MAVDLSSIVRDGKLQLARALAIESYASVEQSLAHLFASLLGTPQDRSGVVFFRLTNTHSRNAIFEAHLEKRHGDKFNAYWHGVKNQSGLFALIRQLDSRRNEIVHWHVVKEIRGTATKEALYPPNFWNLKPETPSIDADQLKEFTSKADFVHRSIRMFAVMIDPDLSITEDERAPWLRIFEQPASYPPEDTHPLSPTHAARGIPPPA